MLTVPGFCVSDVMSVPLHDGDSWFIWFLDFVLVLISLVVGFFGFWFL